MRLQADRNSYQSNDDFQTPQHLADMLVKHFSPGWYVLEPCRGVDRSFYHALCRSSIIDRIDYCEIKEGLNFFDYQGTPDWIITNPPWSKIGEWKQGKYFLGGQWSDWVDCRTDETWNRLRDADWPKSWLEKRDHIGFLEKAFQVAQHVVFLCTTNHVFNTRREADARKYGFGLKEICYVDWPAEWVKCGFLLSANYWQKGYKGDICLTDLRTKK